MHKILLYVFGQWIEFTFSYGPRISFVRSSNKVGGKISAILVSVQMYFGNDKVAEKPCSTTEGRGERKASSVLPGWVCCFSQFC